LETTEWNDQKTMRVSGRTERTDAVKWKSPKLVVRHAELMPVASLVDRTRKARRGIGKNHPHYELLEQTEACIVDLSVQLHTAKSRVVGTGAGWFVMLLVRGWRV
jgi:hypothetical protein